MSLSAPYLLTPANTKGLFLRCHLIQLEHANRLRTYSTLAEQWIKFTVPVELNKEAKLTPLS